MSGSSSSRNSSDCLRNTPLVISIATTTAKVIKDAEKSGVDPNIIKTMSINFQSQLYSLMNGASTTPATNQQQAPSVSTPTTILAGVPSTSSAGSLTVNQYLQPFHNKCVKCADDLFCGKCGFI